MKGGFWPGPCREFAPAGDLLSGRPESRQRVAPVPSPLRFAAGCPAMLETRGRAELTSLRSVQTSGAKSVDEVRCAHAPGSCASRLLQGGVKEQPNSPIAKPGSRSVRGIWVPPSEPAEKRRALSPFAKRTSTSDSRRLSEQSAATRVRRAGSRTEHRRGPGAQRRAGGSGAVSLVTFLGAQESDSPAGAKSPHHTRHHAEAASSPPPSPTRCRAAGTTLTPRP